MKCKHFWNIIAGFALVVFTVTGLADSNKLSKKLKDKAQGGGNERVSVIVQYHAMPDSAENDRLTGLNAQNKRAYGKLKMRALEVKASKLSKLANHPKVRFVTLDNAVESYSQAARVTANMPVKGTDNYSYRGSGVGVAVIDSGVYLHEDQDEGGMLQYSFLGGQFNAPGNSQPLSDDFGHGTHVAGIISGDGSNSAKKRNKGVAKEAPIVSLQVLDSDGRGVVSDVIAALDWILQYGTARDLQVVNMSLGKAVETEAAQDPLVQAVEAVWDAGYVVVCSAGNYGRDGHFTITSPANSRKVITVGSLTYNGTGTDISDDYVSTYSSRGPTLHDHVLKPDLVAPGNRFIAAIPEVAQLRTDLPNRVELCSAGNCDDDYLKLSGTSMAAAVVSATVARMLEKDPTLSPDTVKARLMRSARKIAGDPTVVGAGVLDIDAAMNDTGVMTVPALSPMMALGTDENGSTVVLVENSGYLWSDAQWAAGYLW
ncbi:MAG: S8 family peptidase, partial [Thiogranum sp.]